MTIDEAIKQIESTAKTASASAEIKVVKVSDEEARISVYSPIAEMQAVKDATFQPVLDLLTQDLDVQVFVYDKDNPSATA
ncbi:MAG: hypothetical protein QGD96_09605 [Anaerolineae bacterium]|nr:hypothetical protein [Anaerolineae bacterium]